MGNPLDDMKEFHWMMDVIQNVDVGLVVLDEHYRIHIWNGFMETHSGLLPSQARDKNLFDLFPEIDKGWFIAKATPVFKLNIRAFTIWEQRPYLIRFRNYRPITGPEEFMYQNVTISPILSTTRKVEHICLMIYDVTDAAVGKKHLESASVRLEESGNS